MPRMPRSRLVLPSHPAAPGRYDLEVMETYKKAFTTALRRSGYNPWLKYPVSHETVAAAVHDQNALDTLTVNQQIFSAVYDSIPLDASTVDLRAAIEKAGAIEGEEDWVDGNAAIKRILLDTNVDTDKANAATYYMMYMSHMASVMADSTLLPDFDARANQLTKLSLSAATFKTTSSDECAMMLRVTVPLRFRQQVNAMYDQKAPIRDYDAFSFGVRQLFVREHHDDLMRSEPRLILPGTGRQNISEQHVENNLHCQTGQANRNPCGCKVAGG